MISPEDRAVTIIRQCKRKGKALAVYRIGGSFRTAVLDSSVDASEPSLVGVYNENCPEEWLEADLKHALERADLRAAA